MKLLAHLVRFDLRRFRWVILLWCLLVAADIVVTGVRPALIGDIFRYENVGMVGGLLWAAIEIGMAVIVPLVVQAHPVVGSDAFWMTRPVPPRTLFAAKVLLLGVLTVLVPAVARLALMLLSRVPLGESLFVALDILIGRGAWLAVLLAGAVVTLNLPRFAVLWGSIFLSLVLIVTVMIMGASGDLFAERFAAASGTPVVPPNPDPTTGVVWLLCVMIAGFGLGAIQYRTRLRRVSVPAGVGALVLLTMAVSYWPFPLLSVPSAVPAWAMDPSTLQLRSLSATLEMTVEHGMTGGWTVPSSGRTRLSVSGLQPGWMPRLELLGASLTTDRGTELANRVRGYQSTPEFQGSSDHPFRVVARQVLGVNRVLVSTPPDPELTTLMAVPAKEIEPLLPAQARYRGDFALHLVHWELVAALPLRPGVEFRDAAYRLALERVSRGPGERLTVHARESNATSSFDRKPAVTFGFYVRSAAHSSAMAGEASEPHQSRAVFSMFPFFVGGRSAPEGFSTRGAVITFPVFHNPQEEKFEWEPAWYDDAELVIVRMTDTGAVARTLDLRQVVVVAKG